MTWEPTDSASSSSSLPKPRFGPSCCYSTYSPSSSVLPSCLTIANRPPFAPRFSLAEPFWAAPDGGWLFICHKAGVVCKPETLCSTTSSLGNSQFRRSWIPLSPPDLNHQLKSLPIESNFGIQDQLKCAVQISRVPQDDGGNDQIEGHGVEILIELSAVTDGAAAIETDGPLQCVMGLSFIEADGDTSAQFRI